MTTTPRKPSPEKRGNGGLFGLLGAYKGMILLMVLMALAGSSLNLLIPDIISRSIDAFSANRFHAGAVIAEFTAAAAGIFVFTLIQSILQTYTSERVARDYREKLAGKISRQSYTYILSSNPARLLTNLTSDMDAVKMFVAQAFVTIVSSLFMIIGAGFLLIRIHWRLALAVLIIVPVIAFTFFMVRRRLTHLFRKSREIIDGLNRVINESIMGSALIRVLNSQLPESLKFVQKNSESRDLGLSIVALFSVLVPTITFISNLAVVTILALGGHFIVAGTLSLGSFAAFNSYLAMLIFPVMMIGFMTNIIASATASYGRIRQVLEVPLPVEKGSVRENIRGTINVNGVSLSYGEKPVLKNISFRVEAGTRTAIIGPTAAGKSQLLYLLTGLVAPDKGTITYDGVPLENYDKEVFHRNTGFVFQDSVLFHLSLHENIAFDQSVQEKAITRAIQTAELEDFITALPDQLETMVSERGTSLSGGQKQRVMLARTLALDPKVLLLDDFTARVDRNTEKRILDNISQNYPGLTLVSVTQKISSVEDYDQIILLMEGEIIASGHHGELMRQSPEYNQIYQSQQSTHHNEL
jgi:ATP-binding cassette subfamily B protein